MKTRPEVLLGAVINYGFMEPELFTLNLFSTPLQVCLSALKNSHNLRSQYPQVNKTSQTKIKRGLRSKATSEENTILFLTNVYSSMNCFNFISHRFLHWLTKYSQHLNFTCRSLDFLVRIKKLNYNI